MKKWQLWLGATSAFLLVACSNRPADDGGNKLQQGQQVQTTEDRYAGYDEADVNFLEKVNDGYLEAKTATQQSTYTYTKDGQEYRQTKTTQEAYEEGRLEKHLIDATYQVDDDVATFKTYMEAEGEKETYHEKYLNDPWREGYMGHGSLLYIHWVKLALEGEKPDLWEFVEKDHQQVELTRAITEESNLKMLFSVLDFPFIVSDQEDISAQLTVTVNQETGAIEGSELMVTMGEGDQEITATVLSVVETSSQAPTFTIDLKEGATPVQGDSDLEKFQTGNPVNAINFYESQVSRMRGDQQSADFYMVHTEQGNLQIAVDAPIIDEELGDFALWKEGTRYALDKDGKVTQESLTAQDNYAYFVQRFIEQFDGLEKLDTSEEEEANTLRLIYREVFDLDEFAAFADATGKYNVSELEREAEAFYVIDYVVDAQTMKLQEVNLWSMEESDGEEISVFDTLAFSSQNQIDPNLMIQNVDAKLLKK